MDLPNWSFVGRRPRHQLDGAATVDVEIQWQSSGKSSRQAAELIDFSRQGARFRSGAALAIDETIGFFLRHPPSDIDVALSGMVRWRAKEDADRWLYGCQFREEVPLETLGELFLSGILAAQPPTSPG
ncbi:MAG TPA: PilZ domain-containing protein [Pirellulales bacterium]|nr:PilZ domain-containing protein [Pirellulales bacterium]